MFTLLRDEWRARRVLVLDAQSFHGQWLCTLLRILGAQVLTPEQFYPEIPGASPDSVRDLWTAPSLCHMLTRGRPCTIVMPSLEGSSDLPHAFSRISRLSTLLDEAREAGVRIVILLSGECAYMPKTYPPREQDPLGGRDAEGVLQSMLQLFALGFSRGLFGDPTSVVVARHGPVIGGGMKDSSTLMRWCNAIRSGEVVEVESPSVLSPFSHVLEPLGGALLAGAMLLRHGDQYAGSWNFSASPESLLTNRNAALYLREQLGGSRPIHEVISPRRTPTATLLDDQRARARLGYDNAFCAQTALSMLASYQTSTDTVALMEEQATAYLQALYRINHE